MTSAEQSTPKTERNAARTRVAPKCYYFFPGTLTQHIHFYHGWVLAARSQGVDLRLTTLLPSETARQQREAKAFWAAQEGVEIHIARRSDYVKSVRGFFGRRCWFGGRAAVHVRQQAWQPFAALRAKTRGRLRFLVEVEGDPASEADFLRNHPYKPGFYDQTLAGYEIRIREQEPMLRAADHVLVVSSYLKQLLCDRYGAAGLAEKITVLPTGASPLGAGLDRRKRETIRSRHGWGNRLVALFVGDVHYSWQSLSSCLAAFQSIRRAIAADAFLVLLVPRHAWPIVQEFLACAGLGDDECLLTCVAPQEIGAYACAADIGLLLRDDHPASWGGSPGKFGDYMLNGLPTLITAAASDYAKMVERDGILPVLHSIDCQDEIVECGRQLAAMQWSDRERIVAWGEKNVACAAYAKQYAEVIRSLAELTRRPWRE